MASMCSLLFCLCFALAAAQMTTNNRQRELGIQGLPVCGLTCLAASLPAHCEADDTPCICESHELAVQMSECMQANCTVADGLTVAKVQASLCRYLKMILLSLYISENTYIVTLALIKVSILTFYLRLFKHYRGFRIAVIISLVVTTLSSIIIPVLTILSCRPVERFWDRDIKRGSCLSIPRLAYANSGLAIIQDVVIITFPILLVAGLEAMTRRKKMYVAGMFGVGGLGCIATILRLSTLEGFGDSIDPSWDYLPVTYWTSIELAAGFIVSCMPAFRTLCHILARKYGIGWNQLHKEQEKGGGGSGGGVTYPADTYRHPAFEDAGEASDAAAGPPSRPESGSGGGGGGGGGNRQSSFEVRTQPRSHVNYHLPRRPARREPGGAVTDIGLPSPRRNSFRPSAGRRELVTI
ncbi:hypothetical protein RB594_007128 [Gaeumannomyces avenae]